MSPTDKGPERRALLIGIDKYKKFPDNFGELKGCVADVELMQTVLQDDYEFPSDNVTVLKNARATRRRILSAFDDLVDRTGKDDIVVIHYAGHGSQMTDREDDEPSGLDSTIVPVDSAGWSGTKQDQRDITDDEIHLRLVALADKTPFITLIFDCCHSGTISRDSFGGNTRSIPADRRPVEELPPSPIPAAVQNEMRESRSRGGTGKGRSGWLPLDGRYVMIAGCRDEEVANEYQPPEGNGKVVHGAVTYFLAQELRNVVSGTTVRDVFERTASKVNATFPRQHPQLEGTADREIFGIRDIAQQHFVRIGSKRGKLFTLEAGAAHGVTVGSKYDVYPAGSRRPDGKNRLGRVTVTRTGSLSSSAGVDAGTNPDDIEAGTRAFETEHDFGELCYRVQIVVPEHFDGHADRLRDDLKAFPLIKIVRTNQQADARVYILQSRTATRDDDYVPQLRSVRAPSWAVVGVDGRLVMPLKTMNQRTQVAENLHRLARFQLALGLENPDRRGKLHGKFDLDLLRQGKGGKWVAATPEASSGQVVYEEGDRIAFRLTNRSEDAVFLNLLEFGIDGSVTRVYPDEGASPEFRAAGTFELFTDGSAVIELPDVFPYAGDPEGIAAVEGLDTVKAVVTSKPADFGFLEQTGVRSGPPSAAATPLAMLFDSAVNGTRGGIRITKVGDEDWTTVTRSFLIRRLSS